MNIEQLPKLFTTSPFQFTRKLDSSFRKHRRPKIKIQINPDDREEADLVFVANTRSLNRMNQISAERSRSPAENSSENRSSSYSRLRTFYTKPTVSKNKFSYDKLRDITRFTSHRPNPVEDFRPESQLKYIKDFRLPRFKSHIKDVTKHLKIIDATFITSPIRLRYNI